MRSHRYNSRRGGSFIELALCVAPFVLLPWSALSFGHAVFAYNNVAFLSREGSRWAAVRARSANGALTSESSIAEYTRNRAAGLDKSKLTVRTDWSDPARAPGSTVKVSVNYALLTLPLNILKTPLAVRSSSMVTILQ